MRKQLAAALICSAAFASTASASWYEPFNYTASPSSTALSLGNGSNQNAGSMDTFAGGGTGGSIWTPSSTPANINDADVEAASLSYTGLTWTPTGNKAAVQAAAQKFDRVQVDQNYGAGSGGPVVYYSMLVKVADMTGFTGTAATGGFFTGLQYYPIGTAAADNMSSNTAGSAGPILIRRASATDINAGFQLGVAHRDAPNTARVYDSTISYTTTDTLLCVVKMDFGVVNVGTDDVATLWVFRDNGTSANPIPLTEPVTYNARSANSVGSGAFDYFFNVTGTIQVESNVRSIIVRGGNTFIPNGLKIDEIRVGNTWDQAIGVPEPMSLGMLSLGAVGLLRRRRRSR